MATTQNCTTEADCRAPERKTSCRGKPSHERACPDCGALECLCRPRFFAGQLLTEQDLNRLDQYIKRKNQLHNRNLHGWGVVNGLMLLCDGCDGVTLTRGYALSPCGDDIVVCEDTSVPICELIQKCRHKKPPDCRPFQQEPRGDCGDLEETWVLCIRYSELATRGITALMDPGCARGTGRTCSCGGGAAGCGCGAQQATRPKPRAAPAQCEPTTVCEGYTFEVYQKPEPERGNDGATTFGGPLVERLGCCLQELFATVPTVPTDTTDAAQMHQWCCRFKHNLHVYLEHADTSNCQLKSALDCVICPRPGSDAFEERFKEAYLRMLRVLIEAMLNCLCLALLPPAPESTHDARVPLATVRVRRKDCKILSVCNWTTERKLLIGWPSLSYWFGVFPIGQLLHAFLDKVCCATLTQPDCDEVRGDNDPTHAVAPLNMAKPTGKSANTAAPVAGGPVNDQGGFDARRVFEAAATQTAAGQRLNPSFEQAADLQSLLGMAAHALGRGTQPLDPSGFLASVSRLKGVRKEGTLDPLEEANLAQFLMLNVLARPVGGAALTSPLLGSIAGILNFSAKKPRANADDELHERLADLEARLSEQDRKLKDLSKRK